MEDDVQKYWAKRSTEYAATAYKDEGRYPFYRKRMDLVLDLLKDRPKGKLLDAGCGGGSVFIDCLRQGWDAYGVDAVEEMVALARKNLVDAGFDASRVARSTVQDLSRFPDGSFDVVLSLGVFEYLRPEEEAAAFREARRVLKDDGVFVVENINGLFDINTFNRFTVNFWKDQLLPRFFGPEETLRLTDRIRGLLTYPEKPDRAGAFSTTRDQVYTKSENPLAYAQKALANGFVQREQAFYRFHAVPPLLFEKEPELEKVPISRELELSRDWIGNFLASGFVSVLGKK